MINFFRKVRQRLLAENKFSKYLLYALGEIILVVIGILIALQINNWNENKKEDRIAKQSINALKFDLAKDIQTLETVIKNSIKDSTDLGRLRKKISDKNITLDTLIHIARFEFNPFIHLGISFNKNTAISLLSTGNINLLPKTVQQQLLLLNALQDRYLQVFTNDVGIYLDNTILYSRKYTFNDYGHIDSNSKLADSIWSKASFTSLGAEFNGLIGVKYSDYHGLIPSLQNIHKETTKLIEHLETYN
ncbi:DUF6090 family protein [Maribacter sp. CXY002]|uniref:DUF6090 family protein n=1 Tax=Maribacter luteocoastalis TaxID=3407671 RepID=UPI003B67E61F